MKRKILMMNIFLLLALALGERAMAQQLVAVAGAGIFKSTQTTEPIVGNFEFIEGRLMFGHGFRYGLMGNYTWVYLNQDKENPFNYKGQFYVLGLSVDKWWQTLNANNYFWINSGIGWGYDHGTSPNYQSWQKDQFFLIKGGLRSTKPFNDWFGNGLFMAELQIPIKTADARYSIDSGIVKAGTPYKKGNLRLTYDNGIKKIPLFFRLNESFIEPTVHIGCSTDNASKRLFIEYGGGVSVGYFREVWDRELFKIVVFKRQDINRSNSQSSLIQAEIVINLLNFYPKN